MDVSENEDESFNDLHKKQTKKRPRHGRLTDVNKKLRATTHELGPSCECKRFKCFEVIKEDQRNDIIRQFNELGNHQDQNLYLGGLITVHSVAQRRTRKKNNGGEPHQASYSYRVRCASKDVPVCQNAFRSLHGITGRRIQTLQSQLINEGKIKKDGRGKHVNRPHRLKDSVLEHIHEHIKSLKGRKSHYSLHESNKLYLSEELNIKKLFEMFKELYPEDKASYESYRSIFNTHYNIGFGYPRCDTCSTCDEYNVNLRALTQSLESSEDKESIENEIRLLNVNNQVHLKKAETFYARKRNARLNARNKESVEAICMDFQKNLNVPNITTNDAYYKRKLGYYLFNIHMLSNSSSKFYVYDETIAKKGSDNVASMLYDFIMFQLPDTVRKITIFCDSCGGQNKNYVIIRFIYYIVHIQRKLDEIKIVFPVRGHSYMECDRNMALINQKAHIELPSEWADQVAVARSKPSPFIVEQCQQDLFRNWADYFKPMFKPKCPIPTRSIKEIRVHREKPKLIFHRDSYNGAWVSNVITNNRYIGPILQVNEFTHPQKLYQSLLPISAAKYNDCLDLAKFCSQGAKNYFLNLPNTKNVIDDDD